jgi:hypothetical protein
MDTARFEKEFPGLARHLGPDNVVLLLKLAEFHEFPAGHALINDMSWWMAEMPDTAAS